MGRPKIKIIDDSQLETEVKVTNKEKRAKSETDEVIGEVETPVILEEAQRPIESKNKDAIARLAAKRASLQHDKKQKPGKVKPRSKKYKEAATELDRNKAYPLTEAVDMAKKMSYSKFNATLEAHVNTAQTGIRGLVSLPFAKGRELRILCFGPSNPQIEGVVFGSETEIEEINKGKINFDIIITTPSWMPKLAKLARILGPRGLMPNPKNGTITEDLKKAAEGFQAGKTEYKTEAKAPVIHIAVGKVDQPTEEITANIKTLLQTLGKSRYKKITLSPTMGPGVKVDLSSI